MHVIITRCVVLLDFRLPGKDDPWGPSREEYMHFKTQLETKNSPAPT